MERSTIQQLYVRVCKDSGFKLDWCQAATLVADMAKCSPLEIWIAMGTINQMMQIASGEHPVCCVEKK